MQESRKEHRGRTKGKPVSAEGEQGECYQWKATGQCTKGDPCSFRHDENKRGTSTRSSSPAPKPQICSTEMSLRGPSLGSPRPCKDNISGNWTNPSCDSWHAPVCRNYKIESGCRFGEKCALMQREIDTRPDRRPNKNVVESSVVLLEKRLPGI